MQTRDDVIAALVKRDVARDRAVQYADAFTEYHQAAENIAKNGVLVTHPRTGAPMENPCVGIRDGALRRLERMRDIDAAFLW